MKRAFLMSLLISLLLSAGCSKEGNFGNEDVGKGNTPRVEAPSPEGAKAHVQKYIDRLLGGDESVKNVLLSMDGVSFGSFTSIEITSSHQIYTKSGEKVDGNYSVRMLVNGTDSRTGKPLVKNVERGVFHKGTGYQIMGAEF